MYVKSYVEYYYGGEDAADQETRLQDDTEIQAFCEDLVRPRAAVNGGLGILGVPSTNNHFINLNQLVDTVTSIIVTCSVTHAATNFPQYHEYGFRQTIQLNFVISFQKTKIIQ